MVGFKGSLDPLYAVAYNLSSIDRKNFLKFARMVFPFGERGISLPRPDVVMSSRVC